MNTETSLRELVNEVKYSLEDDQEKATSSSEQPTPITNLKKYLEHVLKENVNCSTQEQTANEDEDSALNKDSAHESDNNNLEKQSDWNVCINLL